MRFFLKKLPKILQIHKNLIFLKKSMKVLIFELNNLHCFKLSIFHLILILNLKKLLRLVDMQLPNQSQSSEFIPTIF